MIKSEKIKFEKLNSYEFDKSNIYKLQINFDDILYNVMVKIGKMDRVYVLPSTTKQEFKFEKTNFLREDWVNELDNTVIYINDPTPNISNIDIGFGQGTTERYCNDEMILIIGTILSNIKAKFECVKIFATGPASFIALTMGTVIRGSTVIINNPVFYIDSYYAKHVNNLISAIYKNKPIKEIANNYQTRFNINSLFECNKYYPKIVSYHNGLSNYDNITQLNPFIKKIKGLSDNIYNIKNNIDIKIYFDDSTKDSIAKISELKKFLLDN